MVEHLIDNRGKTPPIADSGHELIEVNAIMGGKRSPQYNLVKKFVSEDTYKTWFRTGNIERGDILIPTVGTIGSAVLSLANRGSIAQNIIGLRTKPNINSTFLYYTLISPATKERIRRLDIGVAQPSVKVPHFLNVALNIPDFSTQTHIANVLSSYDDLIENNEKRINILEEMAQRLYIEWFVKFKFPGNEKVKMVESGTEFGIVPEGWEVKKFVDFFTIKYGKNLPTSKISLNGKYAVYGAGGVIGYYGDKNITDKTALITCRGNGSGTVWRTFGEGFVTNNSFTVTSKKEEGDFEFVFNCLKNCNILSCVSGSAQPQITIENINFVKFVLPEMNLINLFAARTKAIYILADELRWKNKKLSEIRDLLIPQLVTGKRELK